MSNFKQIIKIILMFVLLFAMVFAPFFLIEYHNSHRLNEIVIFPIQKTDLNGKSEIIQNYNIWERMGIINKSVVKSVVVRTSVFTELLDIMEEQLAMMYEYNSLPELSFSDAVRFSVFKETYIDISSSEDSYIDVSNSELVLSVWMIYVEYQNFCVCSYMDTETSALYDVTILSKNKDLLYPSDISGDGLLEYLKTFSDIPDEQEEVFSVNSYYTKQKICLYLISENKKTKQVTSYRFNNFAIDTDIILPSYAVVPSEYK